MRFYPSHLNTAVAIIGTYKGEMPFAAFLKNYFSKERKHGSRDRKIIASLCYNYFRTGNELKERELEEKMLASLFLCTSTPNDLLQINKPEWNESIAKPLDEKLTIANVIANDIFPFNAELSGGVDAAAFNKSMLVQPNVFLRIRPGKSAAVKEKLAAAGIAFEDINEQCLSFTGSTRLEEVLSINEEVVVQDFNSQNTGELLREISLKEHAKVWDCCAASGGKSIMAYDLLQKIDLTVSDIRPSIINNLRKRFSEAGIHSFQSFVTDVGDAKRVGAALKNNLFDLVICDAPCSGSGTWSRTPEQLLFFKEEEIARYSHLQKRIVENTSQHVRQGGYLLYITCSVFKKENEEVVQFIERNTSFKLLKMQLLKSYEMKADSMFAALFQKPVSTT